MKAVVMAGGEGSRLRPLTVGRPKPMVPIVNKSVMAHILDLLKSHGITDVVVTLRYMASIIQDFFEDGKNFGLNLSYAVEEYPLGTAGSVKNAQSFLDETFLVISGDAITDFDLSQILQTHKERNALASITLAHVPNPLEYGVITTHDDGHIHTFLEKPSWGEVSSDTVNTGIYVLEPEVLEMIPADTPYDFSTDLFPSLLSKHEPVYGDVATGYWCDIGNLEEYRQANADMLYGKVNLSEPYGTHVGGGIWVGENVDIAPSAQLFGPIYLGHGVKIKGDVTIYGPSVIRDYSIIDSYTRIERSVLWRNSYVGENCEIRGAIITRQCSLKSKVVIFEGVVIADNCVLGERSVIHTDVKLWPRKEVEAGATVKDSIIWGNQGRRALFGRYGVTGVVNVDLTPEFAAKMGAALGASLDMGSYVAINRDMHRSSRMLKRALISGLPGTGIHVWDLGNVPIPVVRYFVRKHDNTSAGIHVRLSPYDQRVVDIRFIDGKGMNQSKTAERAIERTYFREDFRRAYLDEIGVIQYAVRSNELYTEDFLRQIDVETIREAGFRIVIDYSHGLASDTLAQILNKLDVEVVPLNARMDETKLAMLQHEFRTNLERVGKIVDVLDADLGIQLDVGGEKVFLVDEKGAILEDVSAAALMMEVALFANPHSKVAIPTTLPNDFQAIADWHEGDLIRIGGDLHSLMQTADTGNLLLVADGNGNFIFPEFQPAIDGMMATVRLLEYLAHRAMPVSQIVDYLPEFHTYKNTIRCPADSKGMVMRRLNEHYAGEVVDNRNGIKLKLNEHEWVHIAPDPDQPHFAITAEAAQTEHAEELVHEFCLEIERLLPQ